MNRASNELIGAERLNHTISRLKEFKRGYTVNRTQIESDAAGASKTTDRRRLRKYVFSGVKVGHHLFQIVHDAVDTQIGRLALVPMVETEPDDRLIFARSPEIALSAGG